VAAVAVLGCAFVVGWQALGVLYGIFFPPEPPLFPNMQLVNHTNEAHGVDAWRYTTLRPLDDVEGFYVEAGGACSRDVTTLSQPVARCAGRADFSIFALRWQAVITAPLNRAGATTIDLSREVFWLGSGVSDDAPPSE
jgi:hypothetical protein